MLESGQPNADELKGVIVDALVAGVITKDDILDMVSTAESPTSANGHKPTEPTVGADDLPIYTELPEGLIDLPSACEIFGKSRQLLFQWVTQGRLPERGLFKPAGRTIANVVVSEQDVVACISGTDGWRDKRAQMLGKVGAATIGADDLPIYTVLPEGMIDLPRAAREYGCNGGTLRTWVHRGHLQVMGRLKGSCTGGGYLVVSESDLKERLGTPKKKGGRPPKTRNC